MRCTPAIALGLFCLIAEMSPPALADPPIDPKIYLKYDRGFLRDGDRVALIGGTFIEREQRYGYIETVWTLCNPEKTITFRNLGWSGDTVGGVSRSGFDPPEAGFKQLIDQVNAVKPTVIVVAYGANESFAGKAGLDGFVKGLERLIDALRSTKARFIFLPPLEQENLGPPLPDPAKHNSDISLYSAAIKSIAQRSGAAWIETDPFRDRNRPKDEHLTDDGIHLTGFGYWTLATGLGHSVMIKDSHVDWPLQQMQAGRHSVHVSSGIRVEDPRAADSLDPSEAEPFSVDRTPTGWKFRYKFRQLPLPPAPKGGSASAVLADNSIRMLTVGGLQEGRYRLEIDGRDAISATSGEWAKGVAVPESPTEIEQVEQLRQTILKKNELFFHRWRPQNITYLFGFRKHEQGNNAVEIPQFDPLVEEQEKKIAALKKPVPHVYELIRQDAKGAAK